MHYAGQKYCRMLPLEHSAILSTFIKLPFAIKIFVLSIFEWLFYTGFTVFRKVTLFNALKYEPVHEISNNLVCATSKASDQPAHTCSLVRAFDRRLSIL